MKKYITSVMASAALALGTISVPGDPTDSSQNQTPPSQDQPGRAIDRSQMSSSTDPSMPQGQDVNTTQNMPVQDQPGRAYDRAALPNMTPANNPAGGYALDEPAGSDLGASAMTAKAENPATFVPWAFEADQGEIRLSQLAQEKSSSDQVKALAQRLVTDHQAHADKVQQLAQQKNIPIPSQLSAQGQRKLDVLNALNGPSFDKHYLHDMVRDHKKAIAFYTQAAQNNTDPDVKALAQNTLPILREHLQMVEHGATTINEPAGASVQP